MGIKNNLILLLSIANIPENSSKPIPSGSFFISKKKGKSSFSTPWRAVFLPYRGHIKVSYSPIRCFPPFIQSIRGLLWNPYHLISKRQDRGKIEVVILTFTSIFKKRARHSRMYIFHPLHIYWLQRPSIDIFSSLYTIRSWKQARGQNNNWHEQQGKGIFTLNICIYGHKKGQAATCILSSVSYI